jgi:hypothetical protein
MVAGIAERVINDHSNVICPSSHWERRSLKRKGGIRLSRRTQNQNRSMPTKNRSTIQAVTAGQSPPRVEFSLQQPAASAAQPRKRSFGLSSVWPETWTALMGYGGIGDKATIADFPSLHFACSKLQAPRIFCELAATPLGYHVMVLLQLFVSHIAGRASTRAYTDQIYYTRNYPKGRRIPVRDVFIGALSPSDITLKGAWRRLKAESPPSPLLSTVSSSHSLLHF